MPTILEKETERPAKEFRILREPDWRTAAWAGILASVVAMVLQGILYAATGHGPWSFLRMMVLTVTSPGSLPYMTNYNSVVAAGGIVLSLILGVGYSAILSDFISYQRTGTAVAMGLVFGIVVYWINFYGLSSLFPNVVQYRDWMNWVPHIVFGGVLAWFYKLLEPVFEPMAARRPEIRARAEA